TITEMNPSGNLKIKTADGSVFVYAMSEVQKMEKEEFGGNKVNQETSSTINQDAIDDFFKSYLSKNRPALKYIGASKKNGIKKEVLGQKIYEIEYELILETKQNIYINASQFASGWSNRFVDDFSYTTKGGGAWENTMAGEKKRIEKGKRIVANGTLNFEQTDNGWRSTNFRNKNFKAVSTNYISPEMAEEKKQEQAKKQESYAIKGDWKTQDIAEVELLPTYSNVTEVPIFKNSINSFSVKKLKSKCENCRNDNLKSIDESLKKIIKQTNRFTETTKSELENSSNSSKITFYINDIIFKHLGVKDNGDNKGFSCTIMYGVFIKGNFNTPQVLTFKDTKVGSAKTSLLRFYPTKESAFNGALKKFQKNAYNFIVKYEPYALNVLRVETDKKGKAKKIIFSKPTPFVNIKKGSFLVYKKGGLIIKDKKYSFKSTIGKCKFKGETNDDEITCEISGGKNKKAFAEIVNTATEYIAKSSF
ncbi:MAG: hypothetical protein ACPG6B_04530, partial [Oceanihabitans sp.]